MQSRCFIRKCIDFKHKIINNAFKQKLPQFNKSQFIFLGLAFEGLYLGFLACGFVESLGFLACGLGTNIGSKIYFLRLAFEGLYLGLLTCRFEGNFRLFGLWTWHQYWVKNLFSKNDL